MDSQAEPESVNSTAKSLQFKSKWIVFILMEI